MATFARVPVVPGPVVEIIIAATLPPMAPALASTFHVAPSGVEEGWTFDGVNFAAPIPPVPTPGQLLAAKLAAGCALIGASHASLVGTWALDPTTQFQISTIAVSASQFGLPGGAGTFPYPDASGTPHDLSAADFGVLFKALRDYIAELQFWAASGAIGPPPVQPVDLG